MNMPSTRQKRINGEIRVMSSDPQDICERALLTLIPFGPAQLRLSLVLKSKGKWFFRGAACSSALNPCLLSAFWSSACPSFDIYGVSRLADPRGMFRDPMTTCIVAGVTRAFDRPHVYALSHSKVGASVVSKACTTH